MKENIDFEKMFDNQNGDQEEEIDVLDEIMAKGDVKKSIKSARNTTNYKEMKIPEQIAVENDMTLRELEKYIIDNKENDPELEKEWVLYKETLKIMFAKTDKDSLSEMKQNYNLGIDGKSFPNIGFYFDYDDKQDKALQVIVVQSMLQREKNKKEAANMGIEVMSKKEEMELEDFIGEI